MRSYILAGVIAIATLTGCASDRDNRILGGAAVGGVLGNVIGDGSAGATAAGAVIGGVIGANSGDRRDDRRYDNRRYNSRSEAQMRYDNCRRRGYTHYQCTR